MSTETTDALAVLRNHVPAILRHFAREEAARLEKFAVLASRARTPGDIHAILASAARGAQAIAPGRPDWKARAVFLLGEAEGAAEPETYGCCHPDELCPSHGQAMEAAVLVSLIRDAVQDADGPEDAGMRIAEIIAGGAR